LGIIRRQLAAANVTAVAATHRRRLKNAWIIPGAKVTSVTERRIKQRSSWQQRTPQDDGSPEAIERDCHDIIPYAGFNLLK
jgi:hypothetical protein